MRPIRRTRQNSTGCKVKLSGRLIHLFPLLALMFMVFLYALLMMESFTEDPKPRMVSLEIPTQTLHSILRPKADRIDNRAPLPLAQSQYESPEFDEGEEADACIPMHSWQKETYSTCNSIHELDMTEDGTESMTFINCGTSRCAFSVVDVRGNQVTLKLSMFEKEFSPSRYRRSNRDVMAMERLTASPYVASVFANCGVSQITEYSRGGNIHDLVKRARIEDPNFRDLTPLTKLKIAFQLASAVADLHSFESDGVTSLAHNDICCHQFILVDGIFKLNDFHLSVFIGKSPNTDEKCKTYPFFADNLIKLRSPEEVVTMYNPNIGVDVEMVDCFMLGNVLYYVHTNKWIFEGVSSIEASHRIRHGVASPIPDDLMNSSNGAVKALFRAILKCWTRDPRSRPRAKEISNFLAERLKLEGVDVSSPVKVSIPSLPPGHRYTDTDFYRNLIY